MARLRTMPGFASRAAILVFVVAGYFFRVELVEGGAVGFTLAQDSDPTQPGLRPFQHQELKEALVIMQGHAPFGIVIRNVERILARPGTSAQCRHGLPPQSRINRAHYTVAPGRL